jgi:hypothetical protein
MRGNLIVQSPAATAPSSFRPPSRPLLQRKCACGGTPGPTGECKECRRKRVQTKLAIGSAESPLEREADAVAREVSAGRNVSVSGRVDGASGEESAAPEVDEALRSPGQPLDRATRVFMETRFAQNFAHVRVHTDGGASRSAHNLGALAYTIGSDVVFAGGSYAPGSETGRSLLAHELVHVVQQSGGQTFPEAGAARPKISPAPAGLVCRKASPQDEKQQQDAVMRHKTQQLNIAGFLDNARKMQPDPKKGLRNPDNLFHNTVGMLDAGKFSLTILSPTHYSPDRHFDDRYKYPKVGGDYPADPTTGGPGMVLEPNAPAGKIVIPQPPSTVQTRTLPEKTEEAPGGGGSKPGKTEDTPPKTPSPGPGAAPSSTPFSPSDIRLFTRGLALTEGDFKNTFVHEGQHVADLSPKLWSASSANELLENYKSEFRAFWIQPPPPRVGALGQESIDRLPEPTGKADNSEKVSIADPQKCTLCPAPDASAAPGKKAFAQPKTEMKNPRQKEIFWYILSRYKDQQYDCCYVHNEKFHNEVNQFAYPESVNLINSDRLMNLNLAVQKLNPAMTMDEVVKTNFFVALQYLDALDWAFLKDEKVAKPFWKAMKTNAPKFLANRMNVLVKKATSQGLNVVEIEQVMSIKLRPGPPSDAEPPPK